VPAEQATVTKAMPASQCFMIVDQPACVIPSDARPSADCHRDEALASSLRLTA